MVEPLAGRLSGVADAVLRPELLRGPAQAYEPAHGSPAHLTIEILAVDSRLRLAEDDHHALHRYGLLIVMITPVACVSMRLSPPSSPVVHSHSVATRNEIYIRHRAHINASYISRGICHPRNVCHGLALTTASCT